MKAYLLLFIGLVFPGVDVWAAHENSPAGGRGAGMANASVCLSDFWAVHNNQAALADFKSIAVGAGFENRFLVKELSQKTAAFVFPAKTGVFGVTTSYFGYSLYNETKIGLSYSKRLGNWLSAGVQLDYLSVHLGENYGKKGTFTFEAGILAFLSKDITFGFHVFNPVMAKLSDYDNERIPAIVRAGLSYSFSGKVIATMEIEKNSIEKQQFKAGLEYRVIRTAYLRAGMSTNPTLGSFGFGLDLKNITIDVASSVHQVLGFSPQFSVIYHFLSNK